MERQLTVGWSYVKGKTLCHQLFCRWTALSNCGPAPPYLTAIVCTRCLDSAIYRYIWIFVSHSRHPNIVKPYMHFQSPRISEIITCTTPMMDNLFQCLPARAQVHGFEWYYQLRLFFLRLFSVLKSQGRIKLDTVLWGKSRQQQLRVALDFWNILFAKDIDIYSVEFIKHLYLYIF